MSFSKIRVLIADNHLLIREGVRSILSERHDILVVGEAADSRTLAEEMTVLKPHVVIIDCFMPNFFTPEDILTIRHSGASAGVLVMTTHQHKSDILKVLEYRISNYILKQCDKEEFVGAVYATARKEKFFCGKVIEALLEKHIPPADHCDTAMLSAREIEIINYIALGLTNSDIADKIHLSVHTVSTHRRNVLKKLKVRNSSELIMYGIKTGVIKAVGE